MPLLHYLKTLACKFTLPVVFAVDFRERYWDTTQLERAVLVALAIAADLLAVIVVTGEISPFRAMMSFGALTWLMFPPRLATAELTLSTTQALVSVLVAKVGDMLVPASAGQAPVMLLDALWQLVCFVAMAVLLLRYFRTPKAEMV